MEEVEKEIREREALNKKKKRRQEEEGAAAADLPPTASSSSSKKSKGKPKEGEKAMATAVAADSSFPPPGPSPRHHQAGRGSGRGGGRGHGGWRRDHGGFRPSQSVNDDDLSRRYREATPFLSSASFSLPTSGGFDPADFFRGVCVLGQHAASASMAPVATSSPSASRPRGGPRQGYQQPQDQRGAAPPRR